MVQLAYYLVLLLCIAMTTGCERSPEADSGSQTTSASAGQLDPSKVPADLRELVPLVQEWGIGDSVERGDKVKRATPAERERLHAAIAPHQAAITAWLDSFPSDKMTDEAGAFMYAQLAIEEMPKR